MVKRWLLRLGHHVYTSSRKKEQTEHRWERRGPGLCCPATSASRTWEALLVAGVFPGQSLGPWQSTGILLGQDLLQGRHPHPVSSQKQPAFTSTASSHMLSPVSPARRVTEPFQALVGEAPVPSTRTPAAGVLDLSHDTCWPWVLDQAAFPTDATPNTHPGKELVQGSAPGRWPRAGPRCSPDTPGVGSMTPAAPCQVDSAPRSPQVPLSLGLCVWRPRDRALGLRRPGLCPGPVSLGEKQVPEQ